MITASQLQAQVSVTGAKEAEAQLVGVGAASDGAGDSLKSLALGGAIAAGAAFVGLGAKSIKMAGDFQSATTTLVTGAGEMRSNLESDRQGILKLATDTGTSTDELVKGLYMINSAGQYGAQGLDTLRMAAEGAKVGNASLEDVANGVTTIMTDYASKNVTAAQAVNTLITAVSLGKTHVQDLSNAMATILPTSSAVGVKLNDVAGAMATMTHEGTDAASASTYLRQLLMALEAPAKKGADALKAIGLTTGEVSSEMKVSLPDALKMITDHLAETYKVGSPQYVEALKNIAGGSKQMQGILELTGDKLKLFSDNVATITDKVNQGKNGIAGWSDVQADFNFKVDQAKEVVETLGIRIGTMLLPAASKLFDIVNPLVTKFSDWVGSLSQVSDEIQKASEPIHKVQQAAAPLLDTFDRATAIIPKTTQVVQPLTDTFDRATAILHQTHQEAAPLLDTFDRATAIIPKTTQVVQKAHDAVNPLVALFKEWKPVLVETVVTVEKLAGDVETFATGIFNAANKSGAFQSAIQFIHDILPDVDTFLTGAGTAINTDLLPPLESLITNVGSAAAGFITWLDKSGTAKSAIADLGTAVTITAQALGTLVGWTADIVGWLAQDTPAADAFKGAVVVLGTALVGLKLAETAAGLQTMITKFADGDSIISKLADTFKTKLSSSIDDLATKQFPNLKQAMDEHKQAAAEVAAADERISTALDANKVAADEAAVSEERLGATAETEMAGGVEAGAGASAAALEEVTVAAEEATVAEETIGTTAETKMAGGVEAGAASSKTAMSGLGGMIAGLAISLGIMGNQLAYNATAGKSFVDQFKQGDWLGSLEHFVALGTPGGQLASTIDTFTQIGQSLGLVQTSAQKMDKGVVAAMTDMEKQSIAQGAQLSTGLTNLFQTLQTNADGTFSAMDDSAYSYLKDVENYVSQAQAKALQHQIGKGGANIVNANAYASGTDYAPGGPSLVGEQGAELVMGPTFGNLPTGSRVIPHAQTMAMLGGGGNNQPVHVHIEIGGNEVMSYLVNPLMNQVMRQATLNSGRKVY